MTVKELLNNPSLPTNEKEILLSYILKKDKSYLFAHPDFQLTKSQLTKYQELISRRLKGEPIQYLTKVAHFYGLEFYVDNRVLIPRVETEEMVDQALVFARKALTKQSQITIVDVGTGSGNIIISLAKNLGKDFKGRLIGIDISKDALEVAQKNASLHHVNFTGDGPLINFLQGNLLEPITDKVDLILANLPYVRNHLYGVLDPQILWEPKIAILGGNDGLKYYNQLFEQLPPHLNPNGLLLYEIDGKIYKKVVS